MGKRGPKCMHTVPGFEDGLVSEKGYLRIWRGGRYVMAHRWIWEQSRGEIPADHDIHHVNENTLDNRLENLALVDKVTHKRIHSGCELRKGVWWKPCSVCREFKPVQNSFWYFSKEGWPLYGRCRPCHIEIVVRAKQSRALRNL